MDVTDITVLLLICTPVLANIGYVFKRLWGFSVVAAGIALLLAISLYGHVSSGATFYLGSINWVLLTMVSAVYLLSLLYSHDYIRGHTTGLSSNAFYLLMNLFVASMLFSLTIDNYGLMWGGIEATTICSALLIMTEKSAVSAEATWRYIIIVSMGLVFAFMSVILIYYSFGTLTVSQILSTQGRASGLCALAVGIALVGLGTKAGIFPMHAWLPDAHSEAPAPVSALFSGVLLPTALYVLYMVYQIDPIAWIYVLFAIATVVCASIFITAQRRYKRMFAYSTMENMGVALLGLAIGGVGVVGAVLVLLAHSFGKAGAFYSSGNVQRATGEKEIARAGGLAGSMRRTSGALLLSSFAVTGMPPFGTFVGEFLIFAQLMLLHMYVEVAVVMAAIALAFISLNYSVGRMVFNDGSPGKEVSGLMAAVPLVASIISLLIGVAYIMVVY